MKILLSILFVSHFLMPGNIEEQTISKDNGWLNYRFLDDDHSQKHSIYLENSYFAEDSSDEKLLSHYFFHDTQLLKPLSCKTKTAFLFLFAIYQIPLSNLLTNLPPPTHSVLT